MAGARAQHPLGNRETPRIAAGISPIGGASGQRLRRYFFGASPPGEGGAGNNAKKPGATEGAGNNAGTAMPEMPDNAARHANRQVASTCRTGGGQRASHSRKQAAGDGQQAAGGRRHTAESRKQAAGGQQSAGQQSVGQAAASRIEKISCTYKQPATAADAHTGTAAVPGTGNRRSLRNRTDSAPAKIMQANRYYPQRYRKSSE